jgi:transposase-like protein
MKAVNVKGAYADGDRGFLKALQRLLPTVPFQACVFHKELRMGQYVPVKSVRTSKQMSPQTKHDIKVFQLLFREAIYAETKDASVTALERLKRYVDSNEHKQPERFLKAYRSLAYNFKYTLTHFDHPHMKRDNNLLECFNGILKPRLNLMKSFKKKENLDRYLKLFLTEFRFHPLKESRFKERNGNSPLQLAGAILSPYYNFLRFLRSQLHLSYQLKKS